MKREWKGAPGAKAHLFEGGRTALCGAQVARTGKTRGECARCLEIQEQRRKAREQAAADHAAKVARATAVVETRRAVRETRRRLVEEHIPRELRGVFEGVV